MKVAETKAGSGGILRDIEVRVQERLSERRRARPIGELSARLRDRRPHDFRQAVKSGPKPFVIAEIKYRSPSQGDLGCRLSPVEVASQYLQNGAGALSILTEEDFFGGSRENLSKVRGAFPKASLLMKDFIVDEYQLFEAAVDGADAILLIVSLLGEAKTGSFLKAASDLGLAALVEVHTLAEMEVARRLRASLVGVNNRNLSTLAVNLATSRELAPLKTTNMTLIGESGISKRGQINELVEIGFDGFLVGHALMQTGTPGEALARLLDKKSGVRE